MTLNRDRLLAGGLLAAALAVVIAVFATVAGAAAPKETQQPHIEGIPRVGETLTSTTGNWSNSPTGYAFQWHRCTDLSGNGCVALAGQTKQSYTVVEADRDRTILVVVTASNADGSASANSKPVGPVADDVKPASTKAPSVTGNARVGEVLTAAEGAWTGWPESYAFQWLQCDQAGSGCAAVSGATSKTYTVRASDVGRTLRTDVTAKNRYGSATARSGQTAQVVGTEPERGPLSVANVALPNRLTVSSVQFSPSVVRSRNTFAGRFKVEDSNGRPVAGALVYAIALPYGRVAPAQEVATGSDGWATIQFSPTFRLPLQPNAYLVFFVRARKPGGDLLAGVSTRRLVQLRLDRP